MCQTVFFYISFQIMTEAAYAKSQEEYEDDFEKDLDWLIGEEGRSEDRVSLALLYRRNGHAKFGA